MSAAMSAARIARYHRVMCGRYTFAASWAEVHAFSQPLALRTPAEDPAPAWNIAPTQAAWVIAVAADGAGEARPMRWGLVPGWARDLRIGLSTINARLETAAGKPAFRQAWKHRRCLVPASGYYEWRPQDGVRQPYWIHPADGPLLMFAGLWERWRQPDGDWLESFAILTTAAAGALATLHDRAPVALPADRLQHWLSAPPDHLAARLAQTPAPALAWHAVGRAVGNVRNQGRQLTEPLDPGAA
jgi:putative SOS response-associated peptidase YedK